VNRSDKSVNPSERRRRPYAYLLAALAVVPVWLSIAFTLTPVFIRVFVPFPQLSDAKVLSGSIRYDYGAVRHLGAPAYYIETTAGPQRFFCGYEKRGTRCDAAFHHAGARGTIWHTESYGVIEFDLEAPNGERVTGDLTITRRILIDRFDWSTYYAPLVVFALLTAYAVFMIVTWWRLRRSVSQIVTTIKE
jgi:hypothetical protein